MDDKDREIQKTREYNYVLWTVIVVLGLMIVNLFAQQTCTNEEFVNEVSFASTISSIILSVIAIIMTVVSNDSISSLLHRFRDLHDDIKEVPDQLRQTVKDFNQSCEELKSIEKNLNILPAELIQTKKQIEILTKLLGDSVEKLKFIEEQTNKVDKSLNELKENVSLNSEKYATISDENITLSDSDIKNIISTLPNRAMLALYTIVRIYQQNKVLDLWSFSRNIEHKDPGYIAGVFVTLSCIGLLDYSYPKDNEIFKFKNINSVVLKNIDLFTPSYEDDNMLKEVEKFVNDSMTIEQYNKKFEDS